MPVFASRGNIASYFARHAAHVACGVSLALCIASGAQAQLIDFNALLGTSVPSSLSPYYVAPGLTVTPIVRGSGLNGAVGFEGGFGSDGYSSSTSLDVSQDAYIGFTVTNNSPSTQTVLLNLMSIVGATYGGGPQSTAFESSRTGFGNNTELGLLFFPSGGSGSNFFTPGNPVLNSVNPSVEFRFYGYYATSSSGVFSLGGGQGVLTVSGTITPAVASPEPAPAILLLLCGMPLWYAHRTRSRRL